MILLGTSNGLPPPCGRCRPVVRDVAQANNRRNTNYGNEVLAIYRCRVYGEGC